MFRISTMSNHHCWNYLFFPIIAVLIWYFSGCAPYKTLSGKELVCSGGSINYATYGNAAFPFWCNLTDIEATTLEKADLARSGDPDALLDLAIFASGNIREKEVYEQLGAKIRSFVQTIAPAIDTIREPKEKARALYTAICKAFYHKSFLKNELSGYQYEQSRMTELLRRGKFNCVSSSLLCLVIYR
jgi:FtsZ-binding cell division protein ZapB